MQRLSGLGLALAGLFAVTSPAVARAIAPPPLAQRLAVADTIVIGKVTGIEDMDVETTLTPNGPTVKFRIAQVSVSDTLRGGAAKTVKVGFVPPAGIAKYPSVNLQTGREYLLLLQKHHDGKFLVAAMAADVVENLPGAQFDKEIALVKRCVKLLDNPKAGLQSKDEDDRYLALALLMTKYRGQPTGKTEPLAAEESKAILHAFLAVQDWGKFDPVTRTNAVLLFQRLGLTDKDGWAPPQKITNYERDWGDAAQAWLKQHADTYQIQRFVNDSK